MSVSFDRVSDIYDATRGLPLHISEQVTQCILDLVLATSETQFFEPGIGTGRIALPIVQRGYAYAGVDISEKMMMELRHKLQGTSHRLSLFHADATSLPFADHSFDVAIAVHILHLIPNWQQALAEIRRVLKPTGVFLYTHGSDRHAKPDQIDVDQYQSVGRQWRSILADYGFEPSDYGASESKVLGVLQAQGAKLETVIAAQWRIEKTVGELLDRYQQRMYSSCWQIPDKVFSKAIVDLTAWCQRYYGSLDIDLSHKNQFKIVVVKDWAFD
ncbi:MAG: class I SAM-dependent methyltransferase [Cyanobacteria bacterium CRU_2_1]|nr:class I SAM-dependent methyltransferase [Cyanobacteria bacterium RU_5_0]NJR59458.1 class I SAM-dependent methyltransferase [Cyanobacteria bacterium CRU_2_1]